MDYAGMLDLIEYIFTVRAGLPHIAVSEGLHTGWNPEIAAKTMVGTFGVMYRSYPVRAACRVYCRIMSGLCRAILCKSLGPQFASSPCDHVVAVAVIVTYLFIDDFS